MPASILPRVATAAIERALRTAPVVVLLGARQTGKTILVRSLPQLADRTDGALLLHGGTETFPLTRRVLAVPWWRVC